MAAAAASPGAEAAAGMGLSGVGVNPVMARAMEEQRREEAERRAERTKDSNLVAAKLPSEPPARDELELWLKKLARDVSSAGSSVSMPTGANPLFAAAGAKAAL